MQNYRYIIAIALTLGVILGWNQLQVALGIMPAEPAQQTAVVNASANETAAAPLLSPVDEPFAAQNRTTATPGQPLVLDTAPELPKGEKLLVATPLYSAEFNTTGGILTSFTLSRFAKTLENKTPFQIVAPSAAVTAPMGLLLNESPTWKIGSWSSPSHNLKLHEKEKGEIAFVWEYSGIRLTRVLTFHADSYLIDEKVHLENLSGQALSFNLGYSMSTASISGGDEGHNITKIGYLNSQDKFKVEADMKDLGLGVQDDAVTWGSIQSNYFLAAVVPHSSSTLKARLTDGVFRITLKGEQITLPSNSPLDSSAQYYLGPKLREELKAAPANLIASMDYGWFGLIAEPMIMFLAWIYGYVGNYGIAIIILTLIIKTALWPLARKSYKSMERMRQLQPMIKKIQEKYKDDKQMASQETMRLYKTYKVNPAGGCMPLFLQIPVFIALYQGLLNAVELRHAPFITHLPFTDKIWLADLSAQDPFYITPVIMGISMFIQQKMSPPMGDPTQAKVMMFMPIVFTVLFASFPSGLVLYWLVNNLFSLVQQYLTMRSKGTPGSGGKSSKDVEAPKKSKAPKAESPA